MAKSQFSRAKHRNSPILGATSQQIYDYCSEGHFILVCQISCDSSFKPMISTSAFLPCVMILGTHECPKMPWQFVLNHETSGFLSKAHSFQLIHQKTINQFKILIELKLSISLLHEHTRGMIFSKTILKNFNLSSDFKKCKIVLTYTFKLLQLSVQFKILATSGALSKYCNFKCMRFWND